MDQPKKSTFNKESHYKLYAMGDKLAEENKLFVDGSEKYDYDELSKLSSKLYLEWENLEEKMYDCFHNVNDFSISETQMQRQKTNMMAFRFNVETVIHEKLLAGKLEVMKTNVKLLKMIIELKRQLKY